MLVRVFVGVGVVGFSVVFGSCWCFWCWSFVLVVNRSDEYDDMAASVSGTAE